MKNHVAALIVGLAVAAAAFAAGCMATIKCAVPVGPAQCGDRQGYIISYRYGDFWSNQFYE